MTTIAFDGEVLAVDSLITMDGVRVGVGNKIIKLKDGVLAVSGLLEDGVAAAEWLDNQALPKPSLGDFNGLFISEDGKRVIEYSEKLIPIPVTVPWAGGSGWKIALTAMRLGKSSRDAVSMAIELDVYSGGDIFSWVAGR